MTVDVSTRRTITHVVKSFVDEGKMFTAFEVSLAAKKRGVEQRHRHLRDSVHEIIFQIGGPADYTRTLMDVGAPEQAWVYHLPQDNPYNYEPLPRRDAPPPAKADIPLVVPVGVRRPVKLQTGFATPAAIPGGAYGTDQRGRVCIPVALLAQLGVGAGETVDVKCDRAEESLSVTRNTLLMPQGADATYTVEPDGNVRITQSTLEKAGLDQLQCYRIEGNASRISIREFDWE